MDKVCDKRSVAQGETVLNLYLLLTFRMMFESGKLPPNYDYFRCVVNIPEDVQRVGEPSEAGEQVSVETISKLLHKDIGLEKQTAGFSPLGYIDSISLCF